MKKSLFTKIAVLFALTVVLAACNKYEEGSKFTFLTAKMRITNTWTSSSYEVATVLGSTTSDNMALTITKDGNFTAVGTYLGFASSGTGTWVFNSDKTAVIFDDSGTLTTWTIIKLKNKELKLQHTETVLGSEVVTTIDYTGV